MNNRGKRLVQLALSKGKSNSRPEDEESDLESRLFSSDSEEDPTYYPSDSECQQNMNNHWFQIHERQPATANIEASNSNSSVENARENEIISSSFDKPSVSPVIEVAPIITVLLKTDLPSSTTLECTENEVGEVLPRCNNVLPKVHQKVVRKPDFCYYCENEIQNFARHIQRNHIQEMEVQKAFSLPPKSIERKHLIDSIRKKGNFLRNSQTLFKPVHKSYLNNSESSYVPCPFCLGSYSRKLLWKHKKICPQNKNPGTRSSLSEAQNLLLPKLNVNSDLSLKVFPRMMADKVSLTAKKDYLITAFGARFLNTHREQHHINVCSRKMRELAKVLMESRKICTKIKNLFDLLHPKYFDVVVHSVKIIAKYDPQKDIYLSPTFAMNISRSIKDCCDIAILNIVKRKYNEGIPAAEAEANITLFVRLLESNWKYEISSQAGNDLNTKTWNKVTIVPLAADLKLFRTYLVDKGNEAENRLKENIENVKDFNLLMETVFCRLLLLNRKRVGELQRMKLATYLLAEEKHTENYEEFSEAITAAEKIVLRNFRRVVIRGKRGRGVPVLFSKDLQSHMTLLLQARPHFVKENNLFIFSNLKSDQPIVGYKILQKHAILCGAKNPQALTSTKLRKHLATLSQVLNMSNNDIEQLATFMGHTKDVHNKVYRLPDDVFQTARIAKVLMLMESGDAAKFKGKTLEEIDLNMEEEIREESDEELERLDDKPQNQLEITGNEEDEAEQPKNNKKINKKKRQLVPWTTQQKKVVTDFFKKHVKSKKPPKQSECDILKEKYPDLLENKSWLKIKVYIQNLYTKKTKFDEDD